MVMKRTFLKIYDRNTVLLIEPYRGKVDHPTGW